MKKKRKKSVIHQLSEYIKYQMWIQMSKYEQFSSVQVLSCVRLLGTPWTAAHLACCPSPTPGAYPNSSIESVMPSNHFILCCPLLLPSVFPSIRVFCNESVLCIRWPKYWSFSFSISSSNEYSRLISFRINWLDLLAVQGTLKSLQHHSSKASILRCSAFFIVQLTSIQGDWKTIALPVLICGFLSKKKS